MPSITRVAIVGVGGVGGYIGGKLAGHYTPPNNIEIIFIARGENELAIRSNGLKLVTAEGEQIVRPSIVTHDPSEAGIIDLAIFTVKGYDLERSIGFMRTCIGNGTIILPLLNGVDAGSRIKRLAPSADVWDGCIYLVSRRIAPGVVRENGNVNQMYFGSSHAHKDDLLQVETLFRSAGVKAKVSENIVRTLWEKYMFISPLATITSALGLPIGEIVSNNEHAQTLRHLLAELKTVADAKEIPLPADIVMNTFEKMKSLLPNTTSSMHDDFKKGGRTEMDELTGYVVEQGRELGIQTPAYDGLLAILRRR